MAPPVKDVSVAEFAELLGVTSQRVYQHVQAGMPHRKRGKSPARVVPREAIAWLLERAAEQARPKDDVMKARERKELAEAMLKELQVEQLQGTLVPLADFEAFTGELIGTFAAVAAGRLQRFEREIVATATASEARTLTERIHHALMEGAREYAEVLDSEAATIEAADAARETA